MQLTQKMSAKRELERRRRESPPEAQESPRSGIDDLQISGAILLQRPHKLGYKLKLFGL